jgi:perosamine synthetase
MAIPLYKPRIGHGEKSAISRVLSSGKLSRGKEVETFEKHFAKFVGKKYAVAVNSGTSGLHLLVRCLGWKKGDEIITTPFSYIASANVILLEGAAPIFVDIDPKTLNIDSEKIEEKITSRTKGMLLVHALGLPVDYKKIKRIKEKYHIQVIEDACEAIGKPSDEFIVSKLGVATVYGFHENKQITSAGEGGMIVTDDFALAQKCRSMRDQGRSLEKDWMKRVILGFNFRMTEIQAAFGDVQLGDVETLLKKRASIAKKYSSLLRGIPGLILPIETSDYYRSWFIYFVMTRNQIIRDRIQKALQKVGIASSSNYFPPIYRFPAYKNFHRGRFPNTERASKTLLALPIFYGMTDEEICKVVSIIKHALGK